MYLFANVKHFTVLPTFIESWKEEEKKKVQIMKGNKSRNREKLSQRKKNTSKVQRIVYSLLIDERSMRFFFTIQYTLEP